MFAFKKPCSQQCGQKHDHWKKNKAVGKMSVPTKSHERVVRGANKEIKVCGFASK
jgi:hypothetical protein